MKVINEHRKIAAAYFPDDLIQTSKSVGFCDL